MSAECGGVAYIGEWTDLDGERGVFGGIAHVARGEDVDREPDSGPVRGADDGDRAALERGDGGLEGGDVRPHLERAPCGVEVDGPRRERRDCWVELG